ncbi:hypothetical protein [Mesobacterium pallidum]|uniref:hypothetical protein n=1 Tax=Mesobacterium pallidum TaxID=2872037 RepID=UPI001EE17DBF|nr:hypothetical protein [Mesobacterium pallidum]
MTLLTNLRGRAARAVAYRRTLRELRGLNSTIARDLDIAPGDVRRIAREAVYAH